MRYEAEVAAAAVAMAETDLEEDLEFEVKEGRFGNNVWTEKTAAEYYWIQMSWPR